MKLSGKPKSLRQEPLPDYVYSSELTRYRLKRERWGAIVLVLLWIAGAFVYEFCKFNFIVFLLIIICGIFGTAFLFERFQYCPLCGRKIKCLDIRKDSSCGIRIYHCPSCKIKAQKEHYSDNDWFKEKKSIIKTTGNCKANRIVIYYSWTCKSEWGFYEKISNNKRQWNRIY